jgi:hypothetical protein
MSALAPMISGATGRARSAHALPDIGARAVHVEHACALPAHGSSPYQPNRYVDHLTAQQIASIRFA